MGLSLRRPRLTSARAVGVAVAVGDRRPAPTPRRNDSASASGIWTVPSAATLRWSIFIRPMPHLRGGRHQRFVEALPDLMFQSTPLRGGRRAFRGATRRWPRRFNPRPCAGGDRRRFIRLSGVSCFNPRPCAGATCHPSPANKAADRRCSSRSCVASPSRRRCAMGLGGVSLAMLPERSDISSEKVLDKFPLCTYSERKSSPQRYELE
jgi:hypothetical protein